MSDLDSTRTQTASVTIVIVELDLPLLVVDYPWRYLAGKVNLNERLQVTVNVTSPPDDLMFSSMVIYENVDHEPSSHQYNVL